MKFPKVSNAILTSVYGILENVSIHQLFNHICAKGKQQASVQQVMSLNLTNTLAVCLAL